MKNPDTDRLARAVAQRTGETLTEAVIAAERLERELRAGRAFYVRSASEKRIPNMDASKKTAVKILHVKKTRASKTACEISDRDQVETEQIGASYFLESRDFARGVEDVRAGRPPRFDAYAWDQGGMPATNRQWAYEKGRQFAIAPRSMPLRSKASSTSTRCGCW